VKESEGLVEVREKGKRAEENIGEMVTTYGVRVGTVVGTVMGIEWTVKSIRYSSRPLEVP
jgi:hypothetical protein